MAIEIYTTRTCPFCIRAKALLDRKGARYTEIDVGADPALTVLPVRFPDAGAVRLLAVGDRIDLLATDPQSGTTDTVAAGATVLALPLPAPYLTPPPPVKPARPIAPRRRPLSRCLPAPAACCPLRCPSRRSARSPRSTQHKASGHVVAFSAPQLFPHVTRARKTPVLGQDPLHLEKDTRWRSQTTR